MRDVTGFTLDEALQLLKAEGITQVDVKLTAPPKQTGNEYNLHSRVVRQKAASGKGNHELVVCNFD